MLGITREEYTRLLMLADQKEYDVFLGTPEEATNDKLVEQGRATREELPDDPDYNCVWRITNQGLEAIKLFEKIGEVKCE